MSKRDTFRQKKERRRTTFPYHGVDYVGVEPSAAEIRVWQQSYRADDGTIDQDKILYADESLLAIVLKDDDGSPLLELDEVYDGLFDDHPGGELNSLCTLVTAFCRLDATERRQLRDAVKNLKAAQSNESSLNSPPAEEKAPTK